MSSKKTIKPAVKPAVKSAAKPSAAAKPAKKSPAPTATASPTAAKPPESPLVKYGEPTDVIFGLLRSDDNVRRIRGEEEQEEINASVKQDGAEERMTVYEAEDGTYPVISGSRRHRALVAAGYDPQATISVIVKPRPATRAEDRLLSLKVNLHRQTEWPDTAVAIGEAVGVIDRDGRVRSDEEIRAGRATGAFKTPKQAAAALAKSEETINLYARTARAPYDDLVRIFEAGGSLAHGETYASFKDADKATALDHYLRTTPHAWPVTVVPERKRAPGAGRPTNASKGLPTRAELSPRKQRPEPPKKGGTVWTGDDSPHKGPPHKGPHGDPPHDDPRPATAPPPPPPPPATPRGTQTSFLDSPPPPASPFAAPATPAAPVPDAPTVRQKGHTMVLADELGLPIDLVLFVDAVARAWDPSRPFEQWPDVARDTVETAVELLRQSHDLGKVFQ